MPAKKADYKVEQKKFRDMAAPKVHRKGEKLTHLGWDAKKKKYVEKETANAEGGHVMAIGRAFQKVNRKQYRRRNVDRTGSKSHPMPERKVEHHPAPIKGKPQFAHRSPEVKHPEPLHDPSKSNHQRMLDRKEARNARREAEAARRK